MKIKKQNKIKESSSKYKHIGIVRNFNWVSQFHCMQKLWMKEKRRVEGKTSVGH